MTLIGDIHGNFDTLIALLDKIPDEEKAKGICLVGDLIDRGPKSMEVVDWAIENNIDCVTGNHEMLMVKYGIDTWNNEMKINDTDLWYINGGKECVESYKGDLKKFKEHMAWMEKLPLYKEYKDVTNDKGEHLLVTHSSAQAVWKWSEKRRTELSQQFRDSIVWSRPTTIKPIPNIFNVFGHTPILMGPRLKSCYANIDTGCFYNHKYFFKLTALQFPEMIVFQQECIDTPTYRIF